MPVEWLAGFEHRYVYNRFTPRRPQLGSAHSKPVDTILLHSTEGASALGAFNAYDSRAGKVFGGVHPHITADPIRRLRYQHVPLTRGSYSLKAGDSDGVIQIELVGFAATGWSPDQCRWIGEWVIAPILRAIPAIPLRAPVPFLGPEAGLLAAVWPRGKARMSPTQWANVSGIVGHQHAPYDDHWDPGDINIGAVIAGAAAALNPPASLYTGEDDMQYVADQGDVWLVGPGWHRDVSETGLPSGISASPVGGLKYILEDMEAAGVSLNITDARKE